MLLIKNIDIYTSNEILLNSDVLIEDNKIIKIGENLDLNIDNIVCIDGRNQKLIPGFIDTHIHGGFDYDIMDANVEKLNEFRKNLAKNGVTSILATTITNSQENLILALKSVKEAKNIEIGSNLLGVHFEGPYIDFEKKGAQPGEFIKKATIEDFQIYENVSPNLIKKVTYSPNQDQNFEFTKYLKKQNIIPSLGHSICNFKQTIQAGEMGLSSTTHTLNAMTSFVHDQPGAFGAMLEHENIIPEFILDGKHVSLVMIKHFLKLKGIDSVVVITDSMRAAGLNITKTTLGGQNVDIIDSGRVAVLENTNTLAGSVALMKHCFSNLLNHCGVTLNQAIKLTSTNAAKQLNENKGKIVVGYDADLIILDENNKIKKTIINEKIYDHEEL